MPSTPGRITAAIYWGVIYIFFRMFTLEYWNEGAAEWRGAGYRSEDREAVVRRMRGAAAQCDYCVRFRVALLN